MDDRYQLEVKLLAGLYLNKHTLPDVEDLVSGEDFSTPETARLFENLRGMILDGVELSDTLLLDKAIDDEYGEHRQALLDVLGTFSHDPMPYAEIIARDRNRDQVREFARNVLEATEHREFDSELSSVVGQASELIQVKSNAVSVVDAFDDWQKSVEARVNRQGIQTGFTDLDRRITGFSPGELIVIAGRPGMGKSAFALDIALNQTEPTMFFSLEMSRDQVISRAMSQKARINGHRFRSGQLSHDEWARVAAAKESWSTPLLVDDKPAITLAELQAKCTKQKAKGGLSAVIVDYLQLMVGVGNNRNEQIGSLTRGMKELAKSLQVPVIALSQLNRGLEQRVNKRPTMSDLRESGEIEQDADMILFLYRHGVYVENFDFWTITEVDVAKFREGEPGKNYIDFKGEYTTFNDVGKLHIDQYLAALNAATVVNKAQWDGK